MVVLAGAREVRIVASTCEAATALAGGFRPAVVVLGAGVQQAATDQLTRTMERHPSQAAIPVLALSGDADRVRLRLVSRSEDLAPEPEGLASLLSLLEDFLADPGALADPPAQVRALAS